MNYPIIYPDSVATIADVDQADTTSNDATVGPICSLVPCKARGVGDTHLPPFAMLSIPQNVYHGQRLLCSHKVCRESKRSFRYCEVCKASFNARNFNKLHSHLPRRPSNSMPLGDETSSSSMDLILDAADLVEPELIFDDELQEPELILDAADLVEPESILHDDLRELELILDAADWMEPELNFDADVLELEFIHDDDLMELEFIFDMINSIGNNVR